MDYEINLTNKTNASLVANDILDINGPVNDK